MLGYLANCDPQVYHHGNAQGNTVNFATGTFYGGPSTGPPSQGNTHTSGQTPTFDIQQQTEDNMAHDAQKAHTRTSCPICHQTFGRKSDMTRHARNHDPVTKQAFKCPYPPCDRAYPRKDKLDAHINNRHRGQEVLIPAAALLDWNSEAEPLSSFGVAMWPMSDLAVGSLAPNCWIGGLAECPDGRKGG